MSNTYQKIYVDDKGKRYILIGVTDNDIPIFGSESPSGNLVYTTKVNQDDRTFIVSEEGYLESELESLSIDENGWIVAESDWELLEDTIPEDVSYTQADIDLLRKHNKSVRLKVELLDNNYAVIDNLIGKIEEVTYDKTNKSTIRSTCVLTLSVPSKEQMQLDFEKTWNKRMVELSCGIYSEVENKYVWYKLDRMLLVSGETNYDAETQQIKLKLVDLMASLTSERGSQIGAYVVLSEGANVRNAIIALITNYAPFKRYNVCEFEDTIPYDIEAEAGDYVADIMNLIFEVFPTYEMFYDTNGIFTVRPIPTKVEDPVDIGNNILDDLIISETKQVDFSEIKNTTEIYGRELSGDYVATNCATQGDCYNLTIDELFTELVSGETYTFVPQTNSVAGQKIKIQTFPAYGIYTVNGAGTEYTAIPADTIIGGVPYVVKYFEEKFVLQGELSIHCIVQEITEMPSVSTQESYKQSNACNNVQWIVNPDNPFACWLNPSTGMIEGEIKQVLYDGEYENIYTTELAYERARYENWLRGRLNDEIQVEMIIVPWMDLNQKIEYTSPVTEEVGTWIVQEIKYDFKTWTMTVTANKFYPYYPW